MPPINPSLRGTIYRVPPDAALLQSDPEWHRHLALGMDAARDEAILIYGTSTPPHRHPGAPHCTVPCPSEGGPAGTGLSSTTHYYFSVLQRVASSHLTRRMGELPRDYRVLMPHFARAGIGLGTGLGIQEGRRPPGKRGLLVRLSDEAKQRLRTRFGLLLTPHAYSVHDLYHVVVPLYDMARPLKMERSASWVDVLAPWAGSITGRAGSPGFFAVPEDVVSLWAARHIDRVLAPTITQPQLQEVDTRVAEYLGVAITVSAAAPSPPPPASVAGSQAPR